MNSNHYTHLISASAHTHAGCYEHIGMSILYLHNLYTWIHIFLIIAKQVHVRDNLSKNAVMGTIIDFPNRHGHFSCTTHNKDYFVFKKLV